MSENTYVRHLVDEEQRCERLNFVEDVHVARLVAEPVLAISESHLLAETLAHRVHIRILHFLLHVRQVLTTKVAHVTTTRLLARRPSFPLAPRKAELLGDRRKQVKTQKAFVSSSLPSRMLPLPKKSSGLDQYTHK